MKKLSEYPTVEGAIADWTKTKQFLRLTKQDRIKSIHALEGRYTEAIAKKGQAIKEAQEGPDFVGKANEAIGQWLDQNIGFDTGKVARALLPSSDAQAAIDAAMFAMPGGEALEGAPVIAKLLARPVGRLAMRLGIPTAAGAAGGAVSGDPLGGAASGFAQGTGGEVLSATAGRLAGFSGKDTLNALDFARLRGWLEARLPIKVPNEQAFRRLFRGGEALRKTEELAKKKFFAMRMHKVPVHIPRDIANLVKGQVPGNSFTVPLDEINRILDKIDEQGWDYKNDPTKGHVGKAIRSGAHQIREEVYQALSSVNPKVASDWIVTQRQLRRAKALTNLFSEKGATDEVTGRLHLPTLQKLISDAGPNGYKQDIIQSLDSNEQNTLSSILHKGAKEGQEDVEGRGPVAHGSLGLHFGVFPRASLQTPKFARHVGFVPYDLGRGRALTAALTLGPYRFARGIEQLFTGTASAESKEKAQSLPPTKIVQSPEHIQMPINKSPEEMAAMKGAQ